ncbi:MAG: glycyl-radical enzyme activating protein [Candidatus Aminicenantes bacterium]|nr:glycyl-radical enzyme activating protein [Candidatus Aminicenantes bacterium]
MTTGIIFDLKKFAIHDGPGIRTTVFLKGCPLHCWWCHNPEGQSSNKDLFFNPEKCLEMCTDCITACPNQAITKNNDAGLLIDKNKCQLEGSCAESCPTQALSIIGHEINADELMKEILKDKTFYDHSKGGVTFSGGEPLVQLKFLNEVMQKCKHQNIHTVVDTCGLAPFEDFEKIMDKTDLFLYDLKMMDEKKHIQNTGYSNRKVLDNLKKLAKSGNRIYLRLPLIPDVNDSRENAQKTVDFIQTIPGIERIHLLPFHSAGTQKYQNLKRKTKDTTPLSEERVKELKEIYLKNGFSVKIGG